MKRIFRKILRSLSLLLVISLLSCKEDVTINYSVAENPDYINIGIARDANIVQRKSVYISDEPQHFVFGITYGGAFPAKEDIKVVFNIDETLLESYNENNNTNYSLIPLECFELESNTATIKAGTYGSGSFKVIVTPGKRMEVGKLYLLPISIESVDPKVNINEEMRSVLYAITVSFLPGNVPREHVFSFDSPNVGLLFCKNSDIIRIDTEGNLLLYQLNEDQTYTFSRQIGMGWEGFDNIFYMPENRFLVRLPDKNIGQYIIDQDYNFLSQSVIGWGWFDNPIIFPFKDIIVLSTASSGTLTKFPLSQSGDWDYPNIATIGTGFDIYRLLFCYQSSIIGIDNGGFLWEIPMTDNGVLGSMRQIGSGWDMYINVFKAGDDLLALDDNGDLWRYNFNLNSNWPLKDQN
jgi:hypothetical protein